MATEYKLSYTASEINQKLSKVDKLFSGISLGIASDGLIYIFVDGSPVGTGIQQGQSGDVFGYVDENNTIVLNGDLADGTYSIKYEMEDGSTVDIGVLVLDSAETMVNILDTAYDTDLKTVYGGVGYVANKRVSISAGGVIDYTGNILTGLIPLGNDGDVFHIRGIADFKWVSGKYIGQYSCWGTNGNLLSTEMKTYSVDLIGTDENGDTTLTMTHSKFTLPSGTAYIRFQFGLPTGNEVIITRNQLIPV